MPVCRRPICRRPVCRLFKWSTLPETSLPTNGVNDVPVCLNVKYILERSKLCRYYYLNQSIVHVHNNPTINRSGSMWRERSREREEWMNAHVNLHLNNIHSQAHTCTHAGSRIRHAQTRKPPAPSPTHTRQVCKTRLSSALIFTPWAPPYPTQPFL